MRTSQSYQFDEFPSDDQLWWIRWLDYVTPRHGDTGTAGITVYLSSISDQELDDIQNAHNPDLKFCKYQKTAAINKIHVQASNMPGMTIGSAFRNGASQPLFPFSEVTIDCNTETSPQQLIQSGKPYHTSLSWWKKGTYRFLNQFEYSLENWDDSWLCVLRSGTIDYLIPCPEILRYFYFWSSKMVRIFTKGPWELTHSLAIFPEKTGPDEQDENLWHVTARLGFTLDHCKLLAPLYIDETGRKRANEIYVNFHKRSETDSCPPIKAHIPFQDGPLHLNAKGIWLQTGELSKFLVFQITGHRWPYTGITLNHNIVTDSRPGEIRIPINAATPFGGTVQPGTIPEDEIPDIITSENDPNANRSKINFTIPAPNVEDIYEVRLKKEISRIYIKTPPHLKPSISGGDLTSTGEPFCGGSEHPADLVPIVISEMRRFDWLLNALDNLKSAGKIVDYRAVSPPDDKKRPIKYKKMTLWKMPRIPGIEPNTSVYSSWSFFKKDFHKRVRAALVLKIEVMQKIIYIMELETRPTEGYRALIFKPPHSASVTDAINDALAYTVGKNGIIETELTPETNIDFARGWKHAYDYLIEEKDGEIIKTKKIGINKTSLMGAILAVSRGEQKKSKTQIKNVNLS